MTILIHRQNNELKIGVKEMRVNASEMSMR